MNPSTKKPGGHYFALMAQDAFMESSADQHCYGMICENPRGLASAKVSTTTATITSASRWTNAAYR